MIDIVKQGTNRIIFYSENGEDFYMNCNDLKFTLEQCVDLLESLKIEYTIKSSNEGDI